ncbi:putative geranyl diphosphate diphosphatase [Helianthus debilis subsp. tardiflorus]
MATSDPTMTLQLIDTIQRLGVGYYFQDEINNMLEKLTKVLPDDDLYTVAQLFRLRRHNGLHTNPQEVFHNFMDANGELNKSSSEDIQGLLSLYEASYMGSTEEYILSNAKEITSIHLSRSVSQLSPKLHQKVVDALRLPRHMRMQRLEARRWWERLGLSSKLVFVRDRHVECFLWTVGLLPELSLSGSRIELAKAIAILLVIDDIYDTYGSYDDLVLFTEAIQRWDLNEMEQLPEYMKICFEALYNTNNDICDKVMRERGFSVQSYLRKTVILLVHIYCFHIHLYK